MKLRVAFSWVFLIGGGAFGAHLSYSGQVATDPLVSALHGAYGGWGLYWGVPAVLPWWSGLHIGPKPESRLLKLAFGLVAVPILGCLYGCFGGGLYQHWKHSKN